MSFFHYCQSLVCGSASVELMAGPSVTVGDFPVVAVDLSAEAPGQAVLLGVAGGSTGIKAVGAENPAPAGKTSLTPSPAPVMPSSLHVSFADDVPPVPSNITVVIQLLPLLAICQAHKWCQ